MADRTDAERKELEWYRSLTVQRDVTSIDGGKTAMRLDALWRDHERLDWLETEVEGPPRISIIADEWWRGPKAQTIREAIDAALAANDAE